MIPSHISAGRNAVTVTGVAQLKRTFQKATPWVLKKVAPKAASLAMHLLAGVIKNHVPVDTGLTKSSVKVGKVKRKGKAISQAVIVSASRGLVKKSKGGKVFYPALIEYGRKGVAAHPFMRRGFEMAGRGALRLAMKTIRQNLETIPKK